MPVVGDRSGELDEEEFKTQAEQLRFEDAQGRQWKIGWYTGKCWLCTRSVA